MSSLFAEILRLCDTSLLAHTRVHRLRQQPAENCTLYVKREDESGFSVSGAKRRKYASLIRHIEEQKFRNVLFSGSEASHHVMAFSQLLTERGIHPIALLKAAHNKGAAGNPMLTRMTLLPEDRHLIPREQWKEMEHITEQWRKKLAPEPLFVVPEGAFCREALPGAMTLLYDILRNENEMNLKFDHIFFASGSGLTAAALLCASAYENHHARVHIMHTAGSDAEFRDKLNVVKQWSQEMLPQTELSMPLWNGFSPSNAASYGSVNTTVLNEVIRLAREEGFFTDPLYSAKLFYEVRQPAVLQNVSGNVLLIHCGGATSLSGFADQLNEIQPA